MYDGSIKLIESLMSVYLWVFQEIIRTFKGFGDIEFLLKILFTYIYIYRKKTNSITYSPYIYIYINFKHKIV